MNLTPEQLREIVQRAFAPYYCDGKRYVLSRSEVDNTVAVLFTEFQKLQDSRIAECDAWETKCDALAAQNQQMREALTHHQNQTRPIERTMEALALPDTATATLAKRDAETGADALRAAKRRWYSGESPNVCVEDFLSRMADELMEAK